MSRSRLLMSLVLPVIVMALAGALLASRWAGAGPAVAQGAVTMGLDAVPGGGVDTSRTVTGTMEAIDVDLVITAAGEAYAGWQAKVRYDSAVLAWVPVGERRVTYLYDPESVLHATAADALVGGTIRELVVGSASAPSPPISPLVRMRFQCAGDGTSALHLLTSVDSPPSFSTVLDARAEIIATDLIDAQVTCQGAGVPATTATPIGGASPAATPAGPTATPTPLPPGMEAVPLAAGCQFQAWTGADGTGPAELAGLVGPAGNLRSLWAQQPPPTWKGYSPDFPDVSDMGLVNLLDVVAICVTGAGDFVRPVL